MTLFCRRLIWGVEGEHFQRSCQMRVKDKDLGLFVTALCKPIVLSCVGSDCHRCCRREEAMMILWDFPGLTACVSCSSALTHSRHAAGLMQYWWFTELLLRSSIANCHVKNMLKLLIFLQRNYCSQRFHFCQGYKMVLISSPNRSWFQSQPALRSCLAFLKTKLDFQSFYF